MNDIKVLKNKMNKEFFNNKKLNIIISIVVIIAFMILCVGACSTGKVTNSNSNQNSNDNSDNNNGNINDNSNDNYDSPIVAGDAAIIADHTIVSEFDSIPDAYVINAISNLKIYYGHTSHGSQLLTGLDMLDSIHNHGSMDIEEEGSDLGHNGDTTWVDTTRTRLNQDGSDINVVIWSWCGGVQDNTEEGINTYLNAMNALEAEYPHVKFIYMTGHLYHSEDGGGSQANLLERNEQIRKYCVDNNKILFDFADIESFDPEGVEHISTSDTDTCEWCSNWCSLHTCPTCSDCAHSHCFNCYQKGKAFWWLLARLEGWND